MAIIVVPAVVVIQGIVLRRNKYVQTLLEQYRVMTPEERKRLSKEGLPYRVIPGLGLMAFYMLILILAWQHVIHI